MLNRGRLAEAVVTEALLVGLYEDLAYLVGEEDAARLLAPPERPARPRPARPARPKRRRQRG